MKKRFSGTNISLLVAILVAATPVCAQTPAQTPQAFEVASIRAVDPDHETASFPTFPNTQFTMENMSLRILIAIAYGMSDNRITGQADLLDSAYFTVKAKPGGDTPLTAKQYQPLLQQLLQQRFKLAVHHETKDLPGYALVVAKGGPKLTPAKDKDTAAGAYILEDGLRSAGISTKTLASLLTRPLGQPVMDKTGIEGNYILDLHFAPATSTESTFPSIFTAVQEQLGLKLEPQKVPTDFLVIDHVEKVPTEN
ncbi:MAG TPA: TIGR03435 family protein [Acidobacteriaceae bacterium]